MDSFPGPAPSRAGSPPPAADFARLALAPPSDAYTVRFEGAAVRVDSSDWRNSRLLRTQIAAAYVNFTLFGLADQCIGTIIPRLQAHYGVDDGHVGWIFLASTAGYFLMALVSESFHRRLGVRGVGVFGAMCMAVAFLTCYQRPPYAVFVAAYFFSGLGFGSLDACFNGWMGSLRDSNQLLGILHGFYGVGCMLSPPVVTYFMERARSPWAWNDYYLVLSCVAASVLVFFAVVFRHETPAKYKFSMMLKEARRHAADEVGLQEFGERAEAPAKRPDDESALPGDGHGELSRHDADSTSRHGTDSTSKHSDETTSKHPNETTPKHPDETTPKHGADKIGASPNPAAAVSPHSPDAPRVTVDYGVQDASKVTVDYGVQDAPDLDAASDEAELPFTGTANLSGPAAPPDPPFSHTLRSGLVWAFSVLMLLYVGAEVGFGTWLVSYMTRIQKKSPHYASYMATVFWLGLTGGRMSGGFITTHYFSNELDANMGYIFGSFFFQSMFCVFALTPLTWLLFPASLLSGFMVGPIFPTLIVAAIRVLPVKYHAGGVGFICAFGGGGAALVPFLIGAVAQMSPHGLSFYPYIVALFYLMLFVSWWVLRNKQQSKIV